VLAAAAADAELRGRLKWLKARLPESVSFGTLRLVMAHRARCPRAPEGAVSAADVADVAAAPTHAC
jgi:hypothetical protein